MALDESNPDLDEHDGDIEEDEYAVEKIVDKRVDRKTGATEYLVKWENYDHSDNTWEPVEHLKCPDLILKFEEDRKKELKKAKELEKERPVKRRRSSNASQQESQSKRVRKEERQGTSNIKLNEPEVLLEEGIDDTEEEEEEEEEDGSGKKKNDKSVKDDDTPSSSTETQSSLDGDNNLPKTGFARGLPIESIVGSCTDDDQNIGFFIKWKGADGMDLVDATEIEERAPRELCVWYRNRLYAAIKSNPPVKG